MADYVVLKTKRKELDQIDEDFSDFSLCSPARKIRRLEAQFPAILEEKVSAIQSPGQVVEEPVCGPVNDERAIVLYNPLNASLTQSPSKFSVCFDSDLMNGWRNFWSSEVDGLRRVDDADDDAVKNDKSAEDGNSMAVIPWVPSPFPKPGSTEEAHMGVEMMDVEEDSKEFVSVGVCGSEGMPQWHQQHSMIPQVVNIPTSVTWYK